MIALKSRGILFARDVHNKNQMHQNKIEIEEWIREFRQMKKRSRKVIEEEESVLKLAEEKLRILEDIRTDLNNKLNENRMQI